MKSCSLEIEISARGFIDRSEVGWTEHTFETRVHIFSIFLHQTAIVFEADSSDMKRGRRPLSQRPCQEISEPASNSNRNALRSNLSIRWQTKGKKERRHSDTLFSRTGNGTLSRGPVKRIRTTKTTRSVQLKDYQWSSYGSRYFRHAPYTANLLRVLRNVKVRLWEKTNRSIPLHRGPLTSSHEAPRDRELAHPFRTSAPITAFFNPLQFGYV